MTTTETKRTRTNFYEKAVEWIASGKNNQTTDIAAMQDYEIIKMTAAVFNRDPFDVAVDVVRKSRAK